MVIGYLCRVEDVKMGERSDSATAVDETADDENGGSENGGNKLHTQLAGIDVTTERAQADVDTLESVHRRQLEWALDHAEEAKEATRL